MADVCLVMPPVWNDWAPPLALPYLKAVLTKRGFSVKQYDLNIETLQKYEYDDHRLKKDIVKSYMGQCDTDDETIFRKCLESCIARVTRENPKIVGISFYNQTLAAGLIFAKMIKKNLENTLIVVGGSYLSYSWVQENILRFFDFLDVIVFGEGDIPLTKVVQEWVGNESMATMINIPRIAFRDFDTIRVSKNTELSRLLDNRPIPDFDDLPLDKYLAPVLPVITSIGCPMKCTFCNTVCMQIGQISNFKHGYMERTAERVVTEMEVLKQKYRVKAFAFCDNLVNANLKRLERLCDILIKKDLDIFWYSSARIMPKSDRIDSLLSKMYQAGCRLLFYGIESANQSILNRMNKNIKIGWVKPTIEATKKVGIYTGTFWIAGFPPSTLDQEYETIKFIEKNAELMNAAFVGHFHLTDGSRAFINQQDLQIIESWPLYFDFDKTLQRGMFGYRVEKGLSQRESYELMRKIQVKVHKLGLDHYYEQSLQKILPSLGKKVPKFIKERIELEEVRLTLDEYFL